MKGCLGAIGFGVLGVVAFVGIITVIAVFSSARDSAAHLPVARPQAERTDLTHLTASMANTAGNPELDEPTPLPTIAPIPATGATYNQVCDVREGDMTDPQLEMHANSFAGQPFTGWQGWVYDVSDNGSGYDLKIAMSERGFMWNRDIVIEDIADDLAFSLNVEQPIVFDGTIDRVEYAFEAMCNPMYVKDFELR